MDLIDDALDFLDELKHTWQWLTIKNVFSLLATEDALLLEIWISYLKHEQPGNIEDSCNLHICVIGN